MVGLILTLSHRHMMCLIVSASINLWSLHSWWPLLPSLMEKPFYIYDFVIISYFIYLFLVNQKECFF